MSEQDFNRLVEEALVAQTGDYIDKGVLWANTRIAELRRGIDDIKVRSYDLGQRELHDMALSLQQRGEESSD